MTLDFLLDPAVISSWRTALTNYDAHTVSVCNLFKITGDVIWLCWHESVHHSLFPDSATDKNIFFFLCWSHNLEFIISGDKVSRESMGFFFSLLEKGAEDGDVGYVDG